MIWGGPHQDQNGYETSRKLRLKQLHCALPGESLLTRIRAKERKNDGKIERKMGLMESKEVRVGSQECIPTRWPATKVSASLHVWSFLRSCRRLQTVIMRQHPPLLCPGSDGKFLTILWLPVYLVLRNNTSQSA